MRHPAADCCEKCIVARGALDSISRQLCSKLAPGNNAVRLLTRLGCDPIGRPINSGASGTILPETVAQKWARQSARLRRTAPSGCPVERSSTAFLHPAPGRRQFRLSVDELVSRACLRVKRSGAEDSASTCEARRAVRRHRRTSGQASWRTCAIRFRIEFPTSSNTDSGKIRRISTARARRSSSGASSR